jgi:hypothetical protein
MMLIKHDAVISFGGSEKRDVQEKGKPNSALHFWYLGSAFEQTKGPGAPQVTEVLPLLGARPS